MRKRSLQLATALAVTAAIAIAWDGPGLVKSIAQPSPATGTPAAQTAVASPPVVQSTRLVTEMPPEDSPVREITHVLERRPGGIEVNTYDVLSYYDGHTDTIAKDENGKARRIITKNANGVEVFEKVMAADGKTVVATTTWRDNGTLFSTVNTDGKGVIVITQYYWTGQEVASKTVTQPDGTYVTEFYHRHGQGKDHAQVSAQALWMKTYGNAENGQLAGREEEYSSGVLTVSWETNSSGYMRTVYRADHTVQLKEQLEIVQNNYSYYYYMGGGGGSSANNFSIDWLEEYDHSGKLTRRIEMASPTGPGQDAVPQFVITPLANGTTSRRTIDTDGTVIFEQIVGKDGNVISGKDYRINPQTQTQAQGKSKSNAPPPAPVYEKFDNFELKAPTLQDPAGLIKLMETDPDGRDREEPL